MQVNRPFQIQEPILVTGATGFIGSHLMGFLIKHGYKVRALVLPQDRLPSSWQGRVEIVRGSVTQKSQVKQSLEGVKSLIHLVAKIGDWGEEDIHEQVTVQGTKLLLDEALNNGTRVTLASSIVVYGDSLQNLKCTEDLALGKAYGPYSQAKQKQETLAKSYWERGLKLSIVRPANVYGPGCEPWVHGIVNQLKQSMPALISQGKKNAGLVYVDNVVDILLRATSLKTAIGNIYNAADQEGVTWNQYVHDLSIFAQTPKPRSIPASLAYPLASLWAIIWKILRIKTRPAVTHEALNLVTAKHDISMKRTYKDLEYRPLINYKEGSQRVKKYLHSLPTLDPSLEPAQMPN